MDSNSYQRLLFISFLSLIIIILNSAHSIFAQGISAEPSLPLDTSPNSQPAASPGQQKEMSATSSLLVSSAEYISIPPTTESPSPTLSLSPETPPNLQPVSSPGPNPEISPTSSLASSYSDFSIPPTTGFPPESSPPLSDPPSQFFSLSMSNTPSSEIDPTVKKICDSTDYPDLFLSTIIPSLHGKTDIASVLEVAMNASVDLTRLGMSMAKKLAISPETSPDLITVFQDCTDYYDTALYNFQNAMDAFVDHDVGTMNTMLSAVITDIEDCEDEFPGTDSPLSLNADKVTKMTSNCLAIVSLLQ